MLKIKIFLFYFLAAIVPKLQGQSEGQLCIVVTPNRAFAKVDEQVLDMSTLQQPYCLTLPAGKHVIQFWAKEFEVFSDTILIEEGKTKTYAKGLNTTSIAFKVYQSELKDYHKTLIRRTLSVSGAITGCLLLTTAVATTENNVSDLKSQADAAIGLYKSAVSPEEISANKKFYNERKKKYEHGRRVFYAKLGIGIPVAIISYYGTWRLIKKLKGSKPIEPKYEAKNPWAISRFNLDGTMGFGLCEMKLTYKF